MTGSFGQSPGSASQPEGKHRAAEPAPHSYNLQRPRGKTTGGQASASTAASHGYRIQSPKLHDPAETTTMVAAPHGYRLQPPKQTTVDDSSTSTLTSAAGSAGSHGYELRAPQPTQAPAPNHTYGQLPTAPPVQAYQPPAQKPQDRVVTGPAPYSVGAAISGGFRRLNKNPLPWLLLAAVPLITLVILVIVRLIAGQVIFSLPFGWGRKSDIFNIVSIILLVVFLASIATSAIASIRGALNEMNLDKPRFRDFFRNTRWGKLTRTWVLVRLTYLATLIPLAFCVWLAAALLGAQPNATFGSVTYFDVDPSTYWIAMILAFGVGPVSTVVLAAWFAPKARLMPLITVDDNVGAFKALDTAGRLVDGRYWRVYGSILLINLIRYSGILLLGIGLIYTVPLARLAEAHMYRQLSEGARPVPESTPGFA